MKGMMNKKAQGLPLNVVILAILVIVVLVVVIAFFVGGTGSVMQKIKQIFTGGVAGTELPIAKQFCESYCTNAESLSDELKATSPYCRKDFYIDADGDGNADEGFTAENERAKVKFFCGATSLMSVTAQDWESKGTGLTKALGVGCPHISRCG